MRLRRARSDESFGLPSDSSDTSSDNNTGTETFALYERRLRKLDAIHFEPLRGTYLSTFDVYSTVSVVDGGLQVGQGMQQCAAFVLARVAHEKGVFVKGVTSERKRNGIYICNEMPDGTRRADCRVVWVGNYNFFTKHRKSPWSVLPCDKIIK